MKSPIEIEDILLQVRKPGRYLGNEWNVVKKDFDAQAVTFALCFPDLYEIGMSNVGLRILYGLLNDIPRIACERVFLPDVDMQALLRERNLPLFSLESKIPLSEFNFLGFCLNYELSYTNVLAVLDLAGIPLLSKDRSLAFPLIIAGGPCATNPEPLADFIDIFFVGEAEEALLEIVEIYKSQITNGTSHIAKEDILKKLAAVEGVYIPSFYDVGYDDKGAVKKFLPLYPDISERITKRVVKDLNNAYYPQKWLVPYLQIVHDRAPIELMRGCPHRCSFCQARAVYQNLRIRSPEKLIEITENILRSSGYEEVSFLSLSTSEYPFLKQVLDGLREKMQQQAVAVSLPSLRPRSYLGNVTQYLAKVRKTTLTLAPEAGSERMRQAINKNFDIEEFYTAIRSAYKAGWQSIKLYFMIGLPDETNDDLDALIDLVRQVSFLRKDYASYLGQVHASISFFIPKPHTAFERCAMDFPEVLLEKRAYLRKKSQGLPKAVRLDFHTVETSMLEAVLSRGDRRLGKVLLKAYHAGCMLDGWTEHFKFDLWRKAFEECQMPMEPYWQALSKDTVLPWQHITLTA